jgi:nucleoside-diphosphate-sugar epimerase
LSNLLLTGVTGRVGRRLVRPLVSAGHAVTVMARSRGADDAATRAAAAGAAGLPLVEAELGGRMGAVKRGDWAVVVHAGLDGAHFPRDARAQRRINVDGSLDLLEAVRPRRFVLISTVRVAGARNGLALETENDVQQPFQNAGEEGMLEAEAALREAAARVGAELVILRLGHVEGIGSDGSPDAYSALAQLVAAEAWRPRHWRSQLRIPGLKAAPMALSPGAWVGKAAAALTGTPAAAGRTFHLLARPPSQEAFFAELAERAGFPGLRIQTPRRGSLRNPTRLEARAHAAIGHQLDYLSGELAFDCSGAYALLAEAGVSVPELRGAVLRRYGLLEA